MSTKNPRKPSTPLVNPPVTETAPGLGDNLDNSPSVDTPADRAKLDPSHPNSPTADDRPNGQNDEGALTAAHPTSEASKAEVSGETEAVDIVAQVAHWSHQGDVQRQARDFEAAITSYDHALELDAANYWAWYHRGSVLEDLERYEEAVDSYSNALTERPDDYWAWYQRGNCLDHLQRFEAAIESYDRAIELRPDDYWAWYRRANVLRHADRHAEAVASYDRALELRPGDFWSWYRRGQALLEARRYNEAINSFQEALTLRPQQANAWYALASCYAHQRLVEQAIACLREALQWGDEDYRDQAAGDTHFSSIRRRKPFQAFLKEPELAEAEAVAAAATHAGTSAVLGETAVNGTLANGTAKARANGDGATDAIAEAPDERDSENDWDSEEV
ncbi:tetratricopeptide repeat protein [Trichothermofontia sp.]